MADSLNFVAKTLEFKAMEKGSKSLFPLKTLEEGRFYEIDARNFGVGLYIGEGKFLGARESFGDIFLFPEEHEDAPYLGTVRVIRKTNLKLEKDAEEYEEEEIINMLRELGKEIEDE